jgi:molybdenum cofactor biosynthesis protein MoaC
VALTMRLNVRLYAILRERAGADSVEIDLDDDATAADALLALRDLPGLEVLDRLPVRIAVNREYADPEQGLAAGDELALIPPVSGGGGCWARVTAEPLSPNAVTESVGNPGAGAIVTFQGTTRDVDRLEYEAYAEMADERIAKILSDCVQRHGLRAAAAEHRVGAVPLGEPSVVVAVSAPHRPEAFAGAREAIDRIKAEAPIWKKEVEAGEGRWVEGNRALNEERLTHLDDSGSARMVDVGAKGESERRAVAESRLKMSPGTAGAVERGDGPKGEVLGTARLAGIQAAKRAGELIPLAHPLPLTYVGVEGSVDVAGGEVVLTGEARTVARTGVEMEAMTAAAVAALTVYDMVKGIERGVEIRSVALVSKSGGRHDWRRDESS